MPSLALVFHLINIADDLVSGDITLEAVQKAEDCCAYLESYAQRIYGMILEPTFEVFSSIPF